MTGWLDVLRSACKQRSQAVVARQLGYTSPVVCQVLKGTYKGDLQRVQAAVEGALMQAEVECPVVGMIPRQRCIEHQRRAFTPTNPTNVQLYRACRSGCAHSFLPPTLATSADQPAVSHNTGSLGADLSKSPRVTKPTGRRKRPSSTGSNA